MTWTVWGSCLLGPLAIPLIPLGDPAEICDSVLSHTVDAGGADIHGDLDADLVLDDRADPGHLGVGHAGDGRSVRSDRDGHHSASGAPVLGPVIWPPILTDWDSVPSRLVVVDGRIGSLIFYLDPKLRAEVREGQISLFGHLDRLPITNPDEVLALPERRLHEVEHCFDLTEAAYESAGRYRLYSATELRIHLRTARTDDYRTLLRTGHLRSTRRGAVAIALRGCSDPATDRHQAFGMRRELRIA